PALSILAIVIILLVLMGISTYRNLDRQASVAIDFLHRQGVAMLDAVEAGARAGMAMHMWQEDSIKSLINEVGSNKDIAYIYMVDKRGRISHHSNPEDFSIIGLPPESFDNAQLHAKIRKLENGEKIYELSKQFTASAVTGHHMMMGSTNRSDHVGERIVLGLKMDYLQIARESDSHHAMMMAGIVIALGSAAIFFTFIIQNYYLVEKTLRQTQDYTSQVISSLSSGIVSIDNKLNITAYNERALTLLEIDRKDIKDVRLEEVLDFTFIGVDQTLSNGITVLDKEINFVCGESRSRPLSISVTPLTKETGSLGGAVIQIRDLSDIKKLEELVRRSEKLAAVGELAAGVAHEIRNPLSSIRGFTQYLGRGFDSESSEKKCSDIVIKEIDRINNVVSDLICFSNPMEPDFQPADINLLITHTLRLVEADAKAQNIVIDTDFKPDLPEISMDEGQITQALLNILLNAIQATGLDGRLTVTTNLIKSGTHILVSVEDDGPGISDDAKGRIFDPYFTTHENGTGLGLPIVHKIIESHEGSIHIISPPHGKNTGCNISIEIPIVQKG
uniref:two-component system sensor histidine kinase NtrB n=1 Tax=Desulfosarcina sp. TaxID=2027861 RepID=UPI003565E91A